MLYAVLFLILAVIAGLMGFGLIAGLALAGLAVLLVKILFFGFVILFLVSLVTHLMNKGRR